MKRKKMFNFTLLILLSIFPVNIMAKEVENSCTYTNGEMDEQKYIYINCDYYKDLSKPACEVNTTKVTKNKESFSNWTSWWGADGPAGKWYKKNRKCHPYLVFIDTKAITGVEVWAFGTLAEANEWKNDRLKHYSEVSVLGIQNVDVTVQEEIQSYIDQLNDIGRFFQLDDYCELKDGKYGVSTGGYSQQLCATAINNLFDSINKWDDNIEDWVGENKISATAQIIKEYEAARKKARSQIHEAWDEKIEDPGDNPITEPDEPEIPNVDSITSRICISCGGESVTGIPQLLPVFVRNIIWLVQIITPIILVGLGMFDFIKAVISSDEKVMKESQGRFIKRIIASVLIFLVVAIVKFVFALIPDSNILGCVSCFISNAESCGAEYICKADRIIDGINDSFDEENSSGSVGSSGGENSSGNYATAATCRKANLYWISSSSKCKNNLKALNSSSVCESEGYKWEEYKYGDGVVYGGHCILPSASSYKDKSSCEKIGYSWKEYKYSDGSVYRKECVE